MEGTKHKILLAEDDKYLRQLYKTDLEYGGFQVVTAVNGTEALQKANKARPNLILLDLIMPEKNGFEVLQELKQDEALRHIPVIVFSNLGQDSDVAKCKKLGAVDYLIKTSVSLKEVREKVQKHLIQAK